MTGEKYRVVVAFETRESDDPNRVEFWREQAEAMLDVSELDYDPESLTIDIEEV